MALQSLEEIPCTEETQTARLNALLLVLFEKNKNAFATLYVFCKYLVATGAPVLDEEDGTFLGAKLAAESSGIFKFRLF